MKVLIAITLSELGGAQRHVYDLINGFRNRHDIALVTGSEGWLTEECARMGVPCYVVREMGRSVSVSKDLQVIVRLRSLIRKLDPDVVHLHSSKAGFLGRIAAAFSAKPVVFTAHGWGFKPGVPWKRRYAVWLAELIAAPLAKQIVCVSQYDLDLGKRMLWTASTRMVLIRNGVEDTSFLAEPATNPPLVVMVARFQEPKLQALLIRLYSTLKVDRLSELWLVGDGPQLDAVRSSVPPAAGTHRIRFLGNRNDVEHILAQCAVFVLLSAYEGMPLSVLEAMRSGLPVVASSVGGIPEIVVDGETGFLVNNQNVADISEKLSILLSRPELRSTMGRAGRARYLENFTLAAMLASTHRIYCQVVGAR